MRYDLIYKFTILTSLLILLLSCKQGSPSSREIQFTHDATVTIFTSSGDEIEFDVEYAIDYAKRAQGLMWRYRMEPNQGMLFFFEYEDYQTFWMKNTYLSLDMIFINSEFEIVYIHENAFPLDETQITGAVPARYVLEVLGGTSHRIGIGVGDRVLTNDL
jgi:hypothetical protein